MSVWIKVCGITEEGALDAALAAGADAVGFVFADSPREIALDDALALKARVAERAAVVAVMRHPSPARAHEILRRLRPDVLQTDYDDLAAIDVPAPTRVLPVVRRGAVPAAVPERLLYEGPASGAGELADWTEARALCERTMLVLAGGLNPGNVADAIQQVRPFGVDVSSGVEARRGVKDPEKIDRFVRAARAAPLTSRPTEDENG